MCLSSSKSIDLGCDSKLEVLTFSRTSVMFPGLDQKVKTRESSGCAATSESNFGKQLKR